MSSIIPIARLRNGGIAQLARACGSYPQCPRFESRCRYQKRRRYFYLRLNFGPLVKRLRHRPFTAVTWVRFPYGSPKRSSSPFRWAAYFCIIYRESKGAVVNDMPGACQSRDPARPQARIPVRVTKTKQLTFRWAVSFCIIYRESMDFFHTFFAMTMNRPFSV